MSSQTIFLHSHVLTGRSSDLVAVPTAPSPSVPLHQSVESDEMTLLLGCWALALPSQWLRSERTGGFYVQEHNWWGEFQD
jgi:hypothetical protein